jgi:ADP-ribosylglycohydrolase
LRDGVPILGVVYAFCYPDDRGDLIAWAEDCGPIQRNGQPVVSDHLRHPPGDSPAAPPVVLLWSGADRAALAALRCVQPARYAVRPSIAYRLALTAVGEAMATAAVNGPLGWDYAAGHALIRAAGGVFLNQRGDAIAYTRDGQSYASRCFGGSAHLVHDLWTRDWAAVFDPSVRSSRTALALTEPEPGRAVTDPHRLDRAQGCLLGQLAGDSLGGQVEFQSAESLAAAYPNGLREMRDGGRWCILAGQPTDDSELALMLARCLVREHKFDAQQVVRSYAYWHLSRPFDIGKTISAALSAAAGGKSPEERYRLAVENANPDSQANGSLMRVSPVGIFSAGQPGVAAELARADSRLTHPNQVCQDACAVYTAAIAQTIAHGDGPQACYQAAVRLAEDLDLRPEVREALSEARGAGPMDYQTYQGWVLIALQNAFHQLLHAQTFEQGAVDTVMAGGDTDTNAAIAGALLGAVHGRSAIPARWTGAVLSCRPLRIANTEHPRPLDFWPVDALELAEALLLAGEESQPSVLA